MKKSLLVTFFAVIMALLTACSGGNEDAESTNKETTDSSPDEAAVQELNVEATNFSFGEEEFVVNAGEEVKINLKSTEGMHGLAISELDVNIEGNGEAVFTPEEPGEYAIYCSIPCGSGHADMEAKLIVE